MATALPGQDVPAAAPAVGAGPLALGSGQRVRVTTDLFDAEIDTVGGDLRRVGLRTYPDSVQQPDQPFQLLRDSGAEIFIAQSGLVALNNTPAPNHYAPFTPEHSEYRLADGQAVSYTHLDVYKRQIPDRLSTRRGSRAILQSVAIK